MNKLQHLIFVSEYQHIISNFRYILEKLWQHATESILEFHATWWYGVIWL